VVADEGEHSAEDQEDKHQHMQGLFTGLSESFEERYSQLVALRQVFEETLAGALQDKFNEYIAQQPQDSYDERKLLSGHINKLMRGVGLGVQCRKTGLVGAIVADTKDAAHPETSRFRITVSTDTGKHTRMLSSRGPLPPLTIMPDDPEKRYRPRRRGYGVGGFGLG